MSPRACLQGDRVTHLGHRSKRVTIALFFPLFFCSVYKAAGVTQVGGLPNLHVRVTLVTILTFSL